MDETTPLLGNGKSNRSNRNAEEVEGETSSINAPVDAKDIDVRFKRWIDHIKRKRKSTQLSPMEREAQFLISVFQPLSSDDELTGHDRLSQESFEHGYISEKEFKKQLARVRGSIAEGLQPKMIQTGSSGSYFVRSYVYEENGSGQIQRLNDEYTTVAVFKPHDEEPYGDFNPKRVFLRRYLWWAMGRPCLIPSFSYLSEVGASLLDERMKLGIVPTTKLVSLASESFFYPQHLRSKGQFPEKQGSYQNFLNGYVNASAFLRAHPWPSRPRSLLERDLRAENAAHGRAKARARKGKAKAENRKKSFGKKLLSALASVNCLAPIGFNPEYDDDHIENCAEQVTSSNAITFEWTKELMQDFRLELEKLVCFDYLIRNTDRGLDNFMVKVVEPSFNEQGEQTQRRRLFLAAIDNSLAFPWKHPAGIRSYPWGWLYLPTDLIGGPFSLQTRQTFIELLRSASWWQQTRNELEALFKKDDHFDAKKFEGQMDVLRGQGWNLLESLRNEDEGPLELCAREKRLVEQRSEIHEAYDLFNLDGFHHPLTPQALAVKARLLAQLSEEERRSTAKSAEPQSMPQRSDASTVSTPADVQPRSLPEDGRIERSIIDDVSHIKTNQPSTPPIEADNQHAGNAALGRAYRRGSLGIDVLTEIDKSTAKARRPRLRQSLTRGLSASRLPKRNQPNRLGSFNDVTPHPEENEESTLVSSVASLDSIPQPTKPQNGIARRRMGSVSDTLSFSAVFSNNETGIQDDINNRSESQKKQKIKAIVEHIHIDDGVAWQTWLGLQ
ncbi:uncharacterized protein FA14DRAFT_160315 [Meira miltonrushii]|uniref:Phosphatidylinositol 4-kinase n=1 Tax=Meira miltonrushii TaxID=1280837 RepID=A0A316VB90_9BASI|nr:uncharacterized protein FA14DRAFT_160315 [Meira miltonrushii]PWN34909.1 hypothetical protein FA14DRAFT_160315 [Meira miltonrushii]